MPGGGGLGGGGIVGGGPAIVPASDIDITSMDSNLVILDLMRLDVATLSPGATANDVIENFDAGLSVNAAGSFDVSSLLSSSSLDALNSAYNQYLAQSDTDTYFNWITQVTSASWAAWDSGPSSDIGNMMAFQQMELQYAFHQFMGDLVPFSNDIHQDQKDGIETLYLVNYAGNLMAANPGLDFRSALDYAAGFLNSDPGRLADFAQIAKDVIETVVVNGTYNPYGDGYVITYNTEDGGGQVTGQGTMGSNIADHILRPLEMADTARMAALLADILGVHHATALHIEKAMTDMNGKAATLTKYVTPDGHIVDTLNVYVATESDPNSGLGLHNVFFDTRAELNAFLEQKWSAGMNQWSENYGQTPRGPQGPNESMLFAGAANPGWSGSMLESLDLNGHHYEFMVASTDWVEINYQHEDAHAEHNAYTEDAAWIYAYTVTGYIH
jgi:hypothetical protein